MKSNEEISGPNRITMFLLLVPITYWLIIDPTGYWLSHSVNMVFKGAVVEFLALLKWLWAGHCCMACRIWRRMLFRIVLHLLNDDAPAGECQKKDCRQQSENKI